MKKKMENCFFFLAGTFFTFFSYNNLQRKIKIRIVTNDDQNLDHEFSHYTITIDVVIHVFKVYMG